MLPNFRVNFAFRRSAVCGVSGKPVVPLWSAGKPRRNLNQAQRGFEPLVKFPG
jgi:hypothetical protein